MLLARPPTPSYEYKYFMDVQQQNFTVKQNKLYLVEMQDPRF